MSQLEHAMLRAPVEAITQLSRNGQKIIAKDMTSVSTLLKTLTASLPKDAATSSAATPATGVDKASMARAKTLASLIKEVAALKKKLEESERAAAKQAKLCSSRLHYLQQVELLAAHAKDGPADSERLHDEGTADETATATGAAADAISSAAASAAPPPRKASRSARNSRDEMNVDDGDGGASASAASHSAGASVAPASSGEVDVSSFVVTPQLRQDRMFAEHLLRNNLPVTAARIISSHSALPLLLDADVFAAARRIEASLLESHDCTRALAWCGENRSRLVKIGSTLEFDLRLQEFLTLVKAGTPIKAIEYARKFLAPAAITTAPAAAAAAASSSKDDAAGSAARNNSEETKDDAQVMVADPARVRILQEAMNLLVFYGFEQDEEQQAAATSSAAGDTVPAGLAASTAASSASSGSPASSASPHPWHKYRVYFSPQRFPQLVREFRATHLAIYGLPRKSALEYALNIGLGAMKTSSCTCSHREEPVHGEEAERRKKLQGATSGAAAQDGDGSDRMELSSPNPSTGAIAAASSSSSAVWSPPADSVLSLHPPSASPLACPVCSYPLSCLAQSLPVAARTQSRLVCRLSGRVMEGADAPLVLPNGYVYGKRALQDMAAANNGRVTCPRTKQTFALTQARIAYVL